MPDTSISKQSIALVLSTDNLFNKNKQPMGCEA